MLRPALAASLLVLLAMSAVAGGYHVSSSEVVHAWARSARSRAAVWWQARVPAGADAARERRSLAAANSGTLRITLQLPGNRQVELSDAASLHDLLAAAMQDKAGLQPTSLELVAVEHVVTRSIPLWRDLVDGLTSLLRLPGSAGSRAASAAETEADLLGALMTADAGEADEVQGQAQWDTLAAARAGEAALEEKEDEQTLPASAFDDAYVDADDADSAAFAAAAAAAAAASAKAASSAAGRRLMKLESAVEELLAQAYRGEGTDGRLFGPARSPAALHARRQAATASDEQPFTLTIEVVVAEHTITRRPGWLFGFGGSSSGADAAGSGGNGAERWVEARLLGSDASTTLDADLAELLSLASHPEAALGQQLAQLPGRRAAAGGAIAGSIPVPDVGGSAGGLAAVLRTAQDSYSSGPVPPAALMAVDAIFVAAAAAALVCTVLLAVDVRRHGWLRTQQEQQRRSAEACAQTTANPLLLPLLVVAADEVAAAEAGVAWKQ